jgi:type III secretion protein T
MPSADLVDVARHEITALLLAMARFTSLLLVMPTFPKSLLPNLVRVGLILSLGIVQQRVLSLGGAVEDLGMFMLVTLLIKEVMLGGAMGFLFGVVFWGAEAAGFFIDNHRGAAIASSINPLTGSETAPLGIFFGQLLTVYFFVSGAFLALIGLVYDSYTIFPVLEFLPTLPPRSFPSSSAWPTRSCISRSCWRGPSSSRCSSPNSPLLLSADSPRSSTSSFSRCR